MFYYKSDMSIKLTALKDEDGNYVNDATVKASLFKEIPFSLNTGPAVAAVQSLKPNAHVINTLAFTKGGTGEIQAGNEITQIGNAASALVTKVDLTSGSWSGDDAAGSLELAEQSGNFAAGTIRVDNTVNEKQTLTETGGPAGGTFKLSFEGQETAALTFDETAADVETALENLSTIDAVACTGGPLNTTPIVVEFQGALVGKDVVMLVLSDNSLTGGSSPTIGIAETVKGVGYVATIASNSDEGGSFTLSFDTETTASIAGNATLADIKSALEALSGITTVTVTGDPLDTTPVGNGFYVTWAATDGKVPLLSIDISSLVGPAVVTVSEVTAGHLLGSAISEDAGNKTGFPVEEHDVTSYQFIWVLGTRGFDAIYDVSSVVRDEIIVAVAYAAEIFTGEEEVFVGIEGGKEITLTYVPASNGEYKGTLPDDLKRYLRGNRHLLMVEAVKGAVKLVVAEIAVAGFYSGT